MLKKFLFAAIIVFALCYCNTKSPTPTTSLDVATTFIRNTLDNNFNEAGQYLLSDDTNLQYFDAAKKQFTQQPKDILANYKAADIIIYNIKNQDDSTTLVSYSNSYKKDTTNLKLKKSLGKWLVDFKYTFLNN
jgi:type IV secretory pathway component VirB8